MRSRIRTVLVLLLTAGLVVLFLRNANLSQVWREMATARYGLIVLATVITLGYYALRAFRWQYLLIPIGPTRFSTAYRTTVIGFAANFLLPARAGEVLRPYLLARREGLSATAAFATIILERLLDTAIVLILFAAFVLLSDPGVAARDPRTFRAVTIGGIGAAAVSVGALVVTFFLAGHPAMLERMTLQLERVLPGRAAIGASRLVRMFAHGLAVMRQPRRLLMALLLSFPLWMSIALGIWLVSIAFRVQVSYMGSFLLMTLLVVGVAVPTPGAVGGFHAAYRIGATTFYGASNDRAVGAAIILHAVSFLPVTFLGLIFTARDGLNFSRMRSLATVAREEGAGEVPVLRPSGR
jgi:uncharacterized protein (TIRG00374 family)